MLLLRKGVAMNKLVSKEILFYRHLSSTNKKNYIKSHMHNEYELIFFLQGDASYTVENKKFTLKKYDLIITRPATHHNIVINNECVYERYNVLFPRNGIFARVLSQIPSDVDVINCLDNSVILNNFKKMDFYSENYDSSEYQNVLFALFLEICYNLKNQGQTAVTQYKPLPPVIKKSIEYINKNLFTIKDVSEISNALYVSKNYFFRIFKNELKISPKKYIINKRLLHAQNMLISGEKPTVVFLECGFDNYTSFYKQYVERFGYAPSKEKKQVN